MATEGDASLFPPTTTADTPPWDPAYTQDVRRALQRHAPHLIGRVGGQADDEGEYLPTTPPTHFRRVTIHDLHAKIHKQPKAARRGIVSRAGQPSGTARFGFAGGTQFVEEAPFHTDNTDITGEIFSPDTLAVAADPQLKFDAFMTGGNGDDDWLYTDTLGIPVDHFGPTTDLDLSWDTVHTKYSGTGGSSGASIFPNATASSSALTSMLPAHDAVSLGDAVDTAPFLSDGFDVEMNFEVELDRDDWKYVQGALGDDNRAWPPAGPTNAPSSLANALVGFDIGVAVPPMPSGGSVPVLGTDMDMRICAGHDGGFARIGGNSASASARTRALTYSGPGVASGGGSGCVVPVNGIATTALAPAVPTIGAGAPTPTPCPHCHVVPPSGTQKRWGPVSGRMVCNACGQYETRKGELRPLALVARKAERVLGGARR
ncbi:hypothetical protein MKEN_01169500 [Mycena kentingensis (nom. inval.)]|nr:hypothetical protein MKEN_01169500 [Mycena kentingensis (nom. inval.)]